MPKYVLVALLLIVFLFKSVPQANSQAFDFAKSYQDYQYSFSIYNESYKKYREARDFYLTNKTLSLKEEARLKTLAMLKDRDQLTIVYLTALRTKIAEVTGLTNDEKSSLYSKIDSEVDWYKNHKNGYGDNDPLVNLFNKSSECEAREKSFTKAIIYEALFYISLGDEVGARNEMEQIYESLKSQIEAKAASGTLDANIFNRWFIDINSLMSNLKTQESEAKAKIMDINKKSYSPESTYESSLEILKMSLKSLKILNNFVIEMQTSLNNQQ